MVDMANPKLVLQGNSTGEIINKILETREKISVPDPLVERISFWPFSPQLLLNRDRVQTYDETMPSFNQLCLIVSYLENTHMEADPNGNKLWMNKCDEMMVDAHRLVRQDPHYSARLAKGPGHTARYIGLIGALEAAMVVVEIYLKEGGLFSVPDDQLNEAISSIYDRQLYRNIRQGQTRLIVPEYVVERALNTVDLNQIIYKRFFAVDSKAILTRISNYNDQTPETKQLIKISKYFLEHVSVFFSLTEVVEMNSFLRRKNNYPKVSGVLKILESKDLLRPFENGIRGDRLLTLYVKVLPRNYGNVMQLLDYETKLAYYDLTLTQYTDSCKQIKSKLKGVLNNQTVLPLLQSESYKQLNLDLSQYMEHMKEECTIVQTGTSQATQEVQSSTMTVPPSTELASVPSANTFSSIGIQSKQITEMHPVLIENISSTATDDPPTDIFDTIISDQEETEKSLNEYSSLSTSNNNKQKRTTESYVDEQEIRGDRRKRSASGMSNSSHEMLDKRVTRSSTNH